MQNIINKISNKRKLIIGIILLPVMLYVLNILMITIFNIGTYMGTFLRYLYLYVVCWKKS